MRKLPNLCLQNFYNIIQLPADPAVSCTCGLQSISATVRYANATSTQQTSISLPLYTTSFSITLPNTHGWAPYNISLAFNNSAGMSGFSEALPVEGPTDSGESFPEHVLSCCFFVDLRSGGFIKTSYLASFSGSPSV